MTVSSPQPLEKRKIIHKRKRRDRGYQGGRVVNYGSYDFAVCGLEFWASESRTSPHWQRVTCKQCLKMRKCQKIETTPVLEVTRDDSVYVIPPGYKKCKKYSYYTWFSKELYLWNFVTDSWMWIGGGNYLLIYEGGHRCFTNSNLGDDYMLIYIFDGNRVYYPETGWEKLHVD